VPDRVEGDGAVVEGLGLLEEDADRGQVVAEAVVDVTGGAAVFTGVLLSGPVLVPVLIRAAGALLGPAGRLATANAVRNPRRTAATTASLLVGVTLAIAVLTGTATVGAALDRTRGAEHPVDVALTSSGTPLAADVRDQVRGTPGVGHAVAVDGVAARVTGFGEPLPVLAAPDAPQAVRDGGAFARVERGEIKLDSDALGEDLRLGSGDAVTVGVGERQVRLEVVLGTGWGPAALVAPETLATLTDTLEPQAIWVRAADGADPVRLVGDLDALADAAGADVTDALQARETEDQQLRIITWSVLGLLGIAVAIALIGIANTLGLSVLERAREHAMLRAIGLTRRQLRRRLAIEAVLLSVTATLLGTVLGVGFAWAGYETVIAPMLGDAPLRVPWPSLGAVVAIAALAGLLACVLPARRAARITPAAGLSPD
jgi:putative ABC transport system permease protein